MESFFDSYEFDEATTYLNGVPPPCRDDPKVRLFVLLAEAGRAYMGPGEMAEVPAAENRRLARRIQEILRERPELGRQSGLPGPFAESGNPVAAPFELAIKDLQEE